MEFSLAHLTVLGCAPPELTYIAARAGYQYISPRIIMMGVASEHNANYDLARNPEMLRQTKTALADTGVKLHDIELARIHDSVDVHSYEPALAVTAELGGHHVISSIWTANRAFALDQFAALCERAHKYGITVDLEFVTWANLATLGEAIGFLQSAKCENVGILIDTLHFHRSRVTLDEIDGVPREWLHFVHLCDAAPDIPDTRDGLIHTGRAERLYVGEGGIDIAAIVNRLPEVPYSIELPHLERVKELGNAEHATRCLETAKKYLLEHPRNGRSTPRHGRTAVRA